LEDLHSHIGNKIGSRLYIIAPSNYVDFISDYYEIGKVKYYFLKVPYQIIKELHKVDFKKFRQPQRKSNINDLEDAIGFHFIRQPQVKAKLVSSKDKIKILIQEFYSDFTEEESGNDMENLESLAMVLIDRNYNGEAFEMDDYFFAEDLLPNKSKKSEESEEDFKKELKKQKEIVIPLNKKDCGKNIMIVYIDIYGNEFKESLRVR
jgi:site-specific DNA-methyltransferase (adenine-specific)/adenine-specific DNA-methyltransferase